MSPVLQRPRRFRNTPLRVVQVNNKRVDGRIDSYWTITPLKNENGKRFRPHFHTKAEAVAEKERKERERRLVGIEGSQMSSALRVDAIHANQILAPLGSSLLTAARHYADYLSKNALKAASLTLSQAKDEYLKTKEKAVGTKGGITAVSFRNIRCRMNVFTNGIIGNKVLPALGGMKLPDITHVEIADFIDNLPYQGQTKAHYRAQIHSFFEFAKRKGFLGKVGIVTNPVKELGSIKKESRGEGVRILSVDQTEELLAKAEASRHSRILVPRLALGLFMGLRPDETSRLDWKDIRFSENDIHIRKLRGKRKQERFPTLNPTAKAWLWKYRCAEGPVYSQSAHIIRKAWDKLRKDCGWKICKDAEQEDEFGFDILRHSFGSYMFAKTQDRAKTTELMGTSLSVFAKHYLKPMPSKSAEPYWNILPDPARAKARTPQKT